MTKPFIVKVKLSPMPWLFWSAACLMAYFPLLLLAGWHIWGPSTMVHEVFETNFFSFQANRSGYFESYTGHFFHVIFLYPIQLIFALLPDIGFFQHAHWFCVAFYFLHGSVLLLILRQIWISPLTLAEKFALLAIPATALWLLREASLGLFINYHKGGVIISLLIAFAFLLWNAGHTKHFKLSALALGVLCAIVIGIKLSWLFVFVPWLVLFAVADMPAKQRLGFTAKAAAWGIATYALLFAIFFFFRPSSIVQSLKVLADYVKAGSVIQRQPYFWTEMADFSTSSYYAGFHAYTALWLASLLGLIYGAFRTRNKCSVCILTLTGLSTLFLVKMLITRATVGTTQDIELFMAMSIVINEAVLLRARNLPKIQPLFFTALWLIPLASLSLSQPITYLSNLRYNSMLARKIGHTLAAHPTWPVHLYFPDLSQPYLFSSSVTYHYFGQPYPMHFVPVRDNAAIELPKSPYILVVAEHIDGPERSVAALKEWPEMYSPYETLRRTPRLKAYVQRLGDACQIYQYREIQDRRYLVNYFYYPTRVTLCAG